MSDARAEEIRRRFFQYAAIRQEGDLTIITPHICYSPRWSVDGVRGPWVRCLNLEPVKKVVRGAERTVYQTELESFTRAPNVQMYRMTSKEYARAIARVEAGSSPFVIE